MLFYSLFSKTGANLLLFSDICKRVSVFMQKSTRSRQTFGILIFYYSMFFRLITNRKYIYFSIYSIKRENVLLEVLSYGCPMGMLWLSYGINSQLPYRRLKTYKKTHRNCISDLQGLYNIELIFSTKY